MTDFDPTKATSADAADMAHGWTDGKHGRGTPDCASLAYQWAWNEAAGLHSAGAFAEQAFAEQADELRRWKERAERAEAQLRTIYRLNDTRNARRPVDPPCSTEIQP